MHDLNRDALRHASFEVDALKAANDEMPAQLNRIALIGSFPPRRCGIATFTADVMASLKQASPNIECEVVAVSEPQDPTTYDASVRHVIRQDVESDYVTAARRLNASRTDVICIQHEFGIFGGPAGDYLLSLTNALRRPVVTTFHTVLERPDNDQRRVMNALLRRSSRVIVMAARGARILIDVYNADPEKIAVCPHGAPDVPHEDTARFKTMFGFDGRDVMLTFGLLSPGKGIETVIRAMPKIIQRDPKALYVVLGATHPHLVRREGEAYRATLTALADELGVSEHVRFINEYVQTPRLLEYLGAADIYVTPYLNEAQITSGTLAYAIALGKPVVSTPYWHAAEVVTPDIGVLAPFGDVDAFAEALSGLLEDADRRKHCSTAAYLSGRRTTWARSGHRYVDAFEDSLEEWRHVEAPAAVELRKVSLDAVKRMTDSCGMYQHSCFGVPDRHHGYCIDDVGRAQILLQRMRRAEVADLDMQRLEVTYASFINHAWNPDTSRFRNFMSFERTWVEHEGSEDSNGRAYWTLGETIRTCGETPILNWAINLAGLSAPHMATLQPIRSKAFCILGADAILARFSDDPQASEILRTFAGALNAQFEREKRNDWVWFEDGLTYDNPRLAQALILAGDRLNDRAMARNGLAALEWLTSMQTAPTGCFRPVGNQTIGQNFSAPAQFDQQPLEALAMIDASLAAWLYTGDQKWVDEAVRAYGWFFGENDLGLRLADDAGGCFDGLHSGGLNQNQGAESILALQLANAAMASLAVGG
ncbi:MAG: glycosyltransferase family 4 protein [Caulobacterales bacterium]